MTQYVYQALDKHNDEIRLVTLLPAVDRDSEVVCDLDIVRLTKKDIPKYEALSYTWGSSESQFRLRVSNLAEALPYLRDAVSPRILWIDSIAINQKDSEERGQQVQRMADIFSLAERVIVWLGKDDASSKKVMEISEILDTRVEIDSEGPWTMRSLTNKPNDAHWGDVGAKLSYDTATWQAIVDFLRRPWFHRLWIWQEIRLAKRNAMILCGTDFMHWTRLKTLLDFIVFECKLVMPKVANAEAIAMAVKNANRLVTTGKMSLSKLIVYMRDAECMDPRDRVYGILGLSFTQGTPTDLRPDYKKPVADVYMGLIIYSAQKQKRLDLLSLCTYEETEEDWPSCIPLLTDIKQQSWKPVKASGRSTCEAEPLENRVLGATGICLGQITTVDGFDAFENLQSKTGVIRWWADRVEMASDIDGQPSSPWQRQAFLKTSSNHIDITPVCAREGDLICVLLGCNTPLVIRSVFNGRYKIIGKADVWELRDNEAFLGPMLKRYKQVVHRDRESSQSHWVFRDQETGKNQVGDPRLGDELPPGWRRITDVQGKLWQDFYHESAPDQKTRLDPRLTKSELLKRGVPLEDIEFS